MPSLAPVTVCYTFSLDNVRGAVEEVPCDRASVGAALSRPGSGGSKPVKVALAPRIPAGPARELPGGRGFLRLVGGTSGPSSPTAPALPPGPPAPLALPAVATSSATPGQLDLLSWTAPPAKPSPPRRLVQLDLFGLDLEPDPKP